MSFKSLVVEETANRRVLPRTKGMHCDVVAYLSPELFAASEEDLWRDAYRSACFPGARAVYLMPDCHKGYVLPVGGVAAATLTLPTASTLLGTQLHQQFVPLEFDALFNLVGGAASNAVRTTVGSF